MPWAILAYMSGDLSLARVLLASVAFIGLLGGQACSPTEVGPPTPGPCSISEPCADGLVCADGACVAPCTADSCGAAGFCDDNTGTCVQCRDNTDCPDGEVCNAFTRECTSAVAGCTGDQDCDRGFCDTGSGACVDCLDDGDCGEAQVCDTLTRSCITQQGCTSDFNCSGTTPVCETNSAVCVQCFADVHCASGTCDTISRTCLAACVDDDGTEPNAASEGGQPGPIASGGEHAGDICPGDVDEFTFTGEGRIEASLTVDGGRLTLTLLNSQGTVLASGATSVNVPSAPAGTFRLRVQGQDAAVQASYLLRLTVTPPAVCTEIDTEPNNATGQAATLPTNGSLRSGTICGSDIDLWTFSAGAGDGVSVTLVRGTGTGTPTFTVENGSGGVVASGTADSPAEIASAPGGALFVRVRATGGDVDYSLRATTTAAPPQCVQQDAEPNDAAGQAIALVPATTVNGQICANDVDQWRFTAAALDDVTVALTGSNVRARVFDAGGAVVGEGTSTFTITDVAAGSYRVEVRGALSTTEAAYTLRVTLTPEPQPDPCTEGGLEPDSFAAPRPIATDGSAAAGRICTGDTDFFRFDVVGTQTVSISVRFEDDDGDLDIRLKDAGGATLTSSSGVSDEELIVRSLSAGSYTVEVFGFSGAQNTYTIAVTAAGDCTEDAFEPNDTPARATPVGPAALTATRCANNDDLYAIRLESGDTLNATLTGTGLTMALLNKTGTVLQGDEANGNGRRLQVSSLPADRYLIRVTGSGVNGVDYTLTPAITPSPARCVDDGAESNNTIDTAFALDAALLADGSYDLSRLIMCDGSINSDHFAIDIPANRRFRVALNHATTSDLDLEVLELRGTSGLTRSLARAISTSTLDVVEGQVNAATRLFIKVTEFGTMPAAGLPYTIGLELAESPTTGCVDDRFDTWTSTSSTQVRTHKNDGITDPNLSDAILIAPTPLSPPETLPALQVCAGNSDFYTMSLTQGQAFQVDVSYVHRSGGDIDLRVFGPDNSNSPADSDTQVDLLPCSSCSGVSGSERFSGTAPLTGTYFIEVFGFSSGTNAYDVAVTLP
jgi:Cys-rich repeat protein